MHTLMSSNDEAISDFDHVISVGDDDKYAKVFRFVLE